MNLTLCVVLFIMDNGSYAGHQSTSVRYDNINIQMFQALKFSLWLTSSGQYNKVQPIRYLLG